MSHCQFCRGCVGVARTSGIAKARPICPRTVPRFQHGNLKHVQSKYAPQTAIIGQSEVGYKTRERFVCGASVDQSADTSPDDLPDSLEESVSNACSALQAVLATKEKKGKKSKAKVIKSMRRLSVEVPVLDTSADTLKFLGNNFAKAIEDSGPVTVVFADKEIAEKVGGELDATVVALQDVGQVQLTSRMVVVQPKEADSFNIFELVDDVWRGEVLVLVNPEWDSDFKDENKQFVESFDVVYSFLPLRVQGMLGGKQGAMIKWVKKKGTTAKWRIFVDEGGEYRCIGQQVKRPSQQEIELALYNASAAESPITKGIQFVKSLTGGK